jgi:hypothetical protein
MQGVSLAIAQDFVRAGIDKAGIPLTETLEAYLSITFARFMDAGAPRDTMRALADECLIACAFFERRLARNGTIRHYVGLGQATYDAAAMTEQAYGFVHMRDVIASAADGGEPEDGRILIDRARAGSTTARDELAEQNVVVGPWGRGKPGLIW